ncbi:MAG TPA: RNA pseudouridine synthase, partial [Bacillota bacterium]|nr:RNA pseudouridine synthase [Bacillota bacterium]
NKPGNVYLGLVHRLDRPVGGIMVFAKTSKAASRLSEQIRTRSLERTYLAIVTNKGLQPSNTLVHYLYKDQKQNKVFAVGSKTKGAKEAILDYSVLYSMENLSLVKAQLHTGRSHQIRVQFQAIGHPIYGDRLYGTQKFKHGQQIALWAYRIAFDHPTKKETLEFSLDPPNTYPWSSIKFFFNGLK